MTCRALVKMSPPTNQHSVILQDFLSPNQQCQCTEGEFHIRPLSFEILHKCQVLRGSEQALLHSSPQSVCLCFSVCLCMCLCLCLCSVALQQGAGLAIHRQHVQLLAAALFGAALGKLSPSSINLVPAQAGKVTVGLASHWPCITDISGSPPMCSRPWRGR